MSPEQLYYDIPDKKRLDIIAEAGGARYTSKQVDSWFFTKLVFSYDDMTDIRKPVRAELSGFPLLGGETEQEQEADDGTVKQLISLKDGTRIESVSIPSKKRLTFCVSTMSGCPARCQFCASGSNGLQRKLTRAEMLTQYALLSLRNGKYATNVVLMGMGEPLLNYDETIGFCSMLNNPKQGNISARKITISTIGIPEGIIKLADEGKQYELAFSLHHPEQKKRERLIPIAKKHSLDEVFDSLRYFTEKTGRIITFEYCLLEGVNDSLSCAYKTADLARELRAKVNLIPYNETNPVYAKPDNRTISRFFKTLEERGVTATIRQSRGDSIRAACGQLRARNTK